MKQQTISRRQAELKKLYQPQGTPVFKVHKHQSQREAKNTPTTQMRPLTLTNLLVSLLLTFFVVFIQLLISYVL